MKINELCSLEEYVKGYSAHYLGFGILIYKNGVPWRQVSNETELHEVIREEENEHG